MIVRSRAAGGQPRRAAIGVHRRRTNDPTTTLPETYRVNPASLKKTVDRLVGHARQPRARQGPPAHILSRGESIGLVEQGRASIDLCRELQQPGRARGASTLLRGRAATSRARPVAILHEEIDKDFLNETSLDQYKYVSSVYCATSSGRCDTGRCTAMAFTIREVPAGHVIGARCSTQVSSSGSCMAVRCTQTSRPRLTQSSRMCLLGSCASCQRWQWLLASASGDHSTQAFAGCPPGK